MIPLNYRFRAQELEYVLNQGGVKFLFYDEEFKSNIATDKIDTKVEHYICVGSNEIQRNIIAWVGCGLQRLKGQG